LCEIDLETITEEKDYHDDIEKFELNEKNKETYLSFLNIYKGNTIDAKEAMKNYSKFANINDDDLLEEHEYLEKIYDISKKSKNIEIIEENKDLKDKKIFFKKDEKEEKGKEKKEEKRR